MASVAKRVWTHKGDTKTAWVVRYKDGARHRSRQFEKQKDAKAYLLVVEKELESETHVARSEAWTVEKLCEEYLRYQEGRWKDGRIGRGRMKQMEVALRTSILPHIGAKRVTDIRQTDVEEVYAKLCAEPRPLKTTRRRMSEEEVAVAPSRLQISTKGYRMLPITAKRRIIELSIVLEWGLARGRVKKNVAQLALKDLRGVAKSRIRTPTITDVMAILKALEVRPRSGGFRVQAFLRCSVLLATFCGLRWGEIVGLTVENIDLDTRMVRVRHSLTHWDELKEPKTAAGVRNVFMPQHVAAALSLWMKDYFTPNDRGLIFRGTQGHQKRASDFHKGMWHPLLKRAGLWIEGGNNLHFHALRHFAVSAAIHSGMPLTDVPSFIGHRDLSTTLGIYTHSVGNDRQALIAEAMADMLREPSLQIEGSLMDADD